MKRVREMRREFTLNEEQHKKLLEACKPVMYLVVKGRGPRSPQENANDAWCDLGHKLGFDGMTVEAVPGKGQRHFTAALVQVREQVT